jgi:predicted amino acid dehydrogenase
MVHPSNEIENPAKISALEVFNLLGFSCILPPYNPQARTPQRPPKKVKTTTASTAKARFNQKFPHINIEIIPRYFLRNL